MFFWEKKTRQICRVVWKTNQSISSTHHLLCVKALLALAAATMHSGWLSLDWVMVCVVDMRIELRVYRWLAKSTCMSVSKNSPCCWQKLKSAATQMIVLFSVHSWKFASWNVRRVCKWILLRFLQKILELRWSSVYTFQFMLGIVNSDYRRHIIISCNLYTFKPLFEGKLHLSKFFLILPVSTVSIQEHFIIVLVL